MIAELEPIATLDRDLKAAARLLSKSEARYLVDQYYVHQDNRIRADAQVRAMSESGEPNRVVLWEAENQRRCEENIKRTLDVFTDEYTVGLWLKSICGIGPVISSGLLAHIDITRAPYFGNIWSFAGMTPVKWEKGKKRPWNAELKTLVAFKLGESFVKVQANKNDYYGKLFRARRDLEEQMNVEGKFAAEAKRILEEKKFRADTIARKAYEDGKLPAAHLHARARRYTVKLFLAHLHRVMFEDYYGRPAPQPYPFAMQEGHQHFLETPNWPAAETGKSLKEMEE